MEHRDLAHHPSQRNATANMAWMLYHRHQTIRKLINRVRRQIIDEIVLNKDMLNVDDYIGGQGIAANLS
jgi:hypothetical protein